MKGNKQSWFQPNNSLNISTLGLWRQARWVQFHTCYFSAENCQTTPFFFFIFWSSIDRSFKNKQERHRKLSSLSHFPVKWTKSWKTIVGTRNPFHSFHFFFQGVWFWTWVRLDVQLLNLPFSLAESLLSSFSFLLLNPYFPYSISNSSITQSPIFWTKVLSFSLSWLFELFRTVGCLCYYYGTISVWCSDAESHGNNRFLCAIFLAPNVRIKNSWKSSFVCVWMWKCLLDRHSLRMFENNDPPNGTPDLSEGDSYTAL